MSVNSVSNNCYCSGMLSLNCIDEEEKQIMHKLIYVYGVTPTGNKTTDRAKLYALEIQEFKAEKIISSKYLTVTKTEQKKYLDSLKEKNKDIKNTNNKDSEKMLGAKIQGEQIFQAITMKN